MEHAQTVASLEIQHQSDSTNTSIQSEGVCSQPADEYTQWNNSDALH